MNSSRVGMSRRDNAAGWRGMGGMPRRISVTAVLGKHMAGAAGTGVDVTVLMWLALQGRVLMWLLLYPR